MSLYRTFENQMVPIKPIAIIAFNRPDYLRIVLDSLAVQQGYDVGKIGLFQDGVFNRISGRRYGSDDIIRHNVDTFLTRFPKGEVFVSDYNVGPALNFDRAERWLFETCDAEAGMLFEDDMEVSPHYLASLNAMLEMALEDGRVSYVACYGMVGTPLEKQSPPTEYVPLWQHWGAGLTRKCWELNKPYIDSYVEVMSGYDYRFRDTVAIQRVFHGWGVHLHHSTQDVAKTAACVINKMVKLNTRAVLGRYIGATGLHIDPRRYKDVGFEKAVLWPGPILDFPKPTEKQYRMLLAAQDNWTGRLMR